MRWSEFAACQPTLAAVAHDQLIGPGVVLIGTTRRDNSARISGVEPLVMDGELWLSMMPTSTKARDLYRDPRILLHSIVTSPSPQAEIMMRGTVRAETGRAVQRRYAAAVEAHLGWRPVPGEFTLLAVDISDITYIGHDAETNAQHVARWPAGGEYLRPVLTPTSLGPRKPVNRLLARARARTCLLLLGCADRTAPAPSGHGRTRLPPGDRRAEPGLRLGAAVPRSRGGAVRPDQCGVRGRRHVRGGRRACAAGYHRGPLP